MEAALTTYKFVDEAPTTYRFADEPAKALPANAGVAELAARVAGLPMDAATAAYNLFKAGVGTAQHKLLGTPLPELTTNPPGGTENVRQMLRATGEPGLSPDNPTPNSPAGTAQYDFVSRGGAIPGGALPAAGSMLAERTLGPEWGPVGALAPQAAITGYNALRAPSLAAEESRNAVRDATFREGQKEGYVVPPSAADGGFISRRLESFGGKAAIGQEAAVRNQLVTNAIARREIGLHPNQAISTQALERRANEVAWPYEEVRRLSSSGPLSRPPFKNAADTLEELKQVRADANNQWKFYDRHPDPSTLAEAKRLTTKAHSLEATIEAMAVASGKPGLVESLRESRTTLGKIHDVDRALNTATGDVSAKILGRMWDKTQKQTGGLATAGRMQNAFQNYMREGEKVPTPGVSKSEALVAGTAALGGYSVLGPYGAALGLLPFASGPTRGALLSRPSQAMLAPDYSPGMTPAPAPQLLYQLGIMSNQNRE